MNESVCFTCKTCKECKAESEYLHYTFHYKRKIKPDKAYAYRFKTCKSCYYQRQRQHQRVTPIYREVLQPLPRLYMFQGYRQVIVCSKASYFGLISGISANGLIYLLKHYHLGKSPEIEGWRLLLFTRRMKVNKYEQKYVNINLWSK